MDSVNLVRQLCKEKGVSIAKLEKECGFSNGYIRGLRRGLLPIDRAKIIADYFGVSIDYLMTGEEPSTEPSLLTAKDERDIAKDMEALRDKLLHNEDGPASYDGEPIPEEDAELLLGQIELMMRRLKPINKEKYNPNKNKKEQK